MGRGFRGIKIVVGGSSRPALTLFITAGLLSTLLVAPVNAYYPRPGDTTIASLTAEGAQASGSSQEPAITPDGRHIAFESIARDLVPGVDTKGKFQVYVHDRHTGAVEIVSVSNEGQAANEGVTDPAISADGRYVVFHTMATNLVPEPTVSWQIYLHDRVTDKTELISRTEDGTPANRTSTNPTVSGDGRFVAYQSYANNLVPGTTRERVHLYLLDRARGEIELISHAPDGSEGGGGSCVNCNDSREPVITPDGRYVAYNSHAKNLVDSPDGPGLDVFVYDRKEGVTDYVSVRTDGTPQDKGAWGQTISADGRYVAFESSARNMTPSNSWDTFHIYVHDRETEVTERVSVSADGVEGDGGGQNAFISGDGRFVAFMSYAFNMIPEEAHNPRPDIFVHDRLTRATELITIAADGGAAESDSNWPTISHDGSVVAYESLANNLVPNDTNERRDVFVRERGPATDIASMTSTVEDDSVSVGGQATFSGAIVSSAVAEPSPAEPVARPADAEITGASVTYRAEREDLLFQSELAALSSDVPIITDRGRVYAARVPAIVYGWAFDAAGASWEVRVQRVAATGAPETPPWDHGAKLFSCIGACVPVMSLRGGVGTAGLGIRAGVSLDALGIQPGDQLANVRAFAAPGELTAGHLAPVGGLALPDAPLPEPDVSLGIAPASSDEAAVAFDTRATLSDGDFSGSLDVSSLTAGPYDVWTKACLDGVCGATSFPVTIGGGSIPTESPTATPTEDPLPAPTYVAFTDASAVSGQYSDESLFAARLTDADGTPVADHELTYELAGAEGTRSFSAPTDADGVAAVTETLADKPGTYQLTVRFAGTDAYEASADTITFVVAKEDTDLALDVTGKGANRTLTARLADRDSDGGVAARLIDFYADSELIGSATTDDNGVATLQAPPRYRGGQHDFEARFDGDDFYRSSAAREEQR